MTAVVRRPMIVGIRPLLRALRSEARRFWPDRRMACLMADIAARDLISAGRVRLVSAKPRAGSRGA